MFFLTSYHCHFWSPDKNPWLSSLTLKIRSRSETQHMRVELRRKEQAGRSVSWVKLSLPHIRVLGVRCHEEQTGGHFKTLASWKPICATPLFLHETHSVSAVKSKLWDWLTRRHHFYYEYLFPCNILINFCLMSLWILLTLLSSSFF